MVQVLLDAGADAKVKGHERTYGSPSNGSDSLVGLLLKTPDRALIPGVARPLQNHLEVLNM